MIDFNLCEDELIGLNGQHNKDLLEKPSLNKSVDLILQQIDILFNTNKRELFGATGFGTDYDQYLFNLTMSNEAIAYNIQHDLESLELFGFTPLVHVGIVEGTLNDIILVTVGLKRDRAYYEKTYTIK